MDFKLTHRVATLSISTTIICAPGSHVRSTRQQCKIADVMDKLTRQRVVVEFLTAADIKETKIHRRLRSLYGEDATIVS